MIYEWHLSEVDGVDFKEGPKKFVDYYVSLYNVLPEEKRPQRIVIDCIGAGIVLPPLFLERGIKVETKLQSSISSTKIHNL